MVLYPPYAAIGKKMNIPIYEHMFACLEWRYPCGCALYSTFFPDGTVPAFSLKHTENRKIECPLVSSKGKHPQKERKQNAKQHTILRHRMQMAALNSRTGVFGSLHDGLRCGHAKSPQKRFCGLRCVLEEFCKHSLPGQMHAQVGKPCGNIGTALHQLAVTVLRNHGKSVFIIV